MPGPAAPPAPARLARLGYDALPGFSALFRAYVRGDAQALKFFRHAFDAAGLEAAAGHAAARPRDRDALADALQARAESWGIFDAPMAASIKALRDPDSAAVVTGQQLGLFGGPLYTLYKTVGAIALARQQAEATGRSIVPVFWVEGEDHDFEEVMRALVLTAEDRVEALSYRPSGLDPASNRAPVASVTLEADRLVPVLQGLRNALPPTAYTEALVEAVEAAHRPGRSWRDAFVALMAGWFAGTGLVFLADDDPALKPLVAPLFRAEIEGYAETLGALERRADALDAAGFHAQVTPMPVNLFLFESGSRYALDPVPEGFALRGTETVYSEADLLALLDRAPERFSPNVVLRPLVQDALVPTLAYVAGPGEIAYWAQLAPVYERFGVPMPVAYPRPSLTVVPGATARVLDRYGLDLPDVIPAAGVDALQALELLHRRLALAGSDVDVEGAFDTARAHLQAAVDAARRAAAALDSTLDAATEAAHVRMAKALEQLQGQSVRAQKRRTQTLRRQLERATATLAPKGTLQERALSPLWLMNRLGPGCVETLLRLPLDPTVHLVWDLRAAPD